MERLRRKWRQRILGFWAQVFRAKGGWINEDAALMAKQVEAALSDAQSGLVAHGYYTPVILMRGENVDALGEQARLLVRTLARLGFGARLETVGATESLLGTLPGHVHPNVRRPLIHSLNFADLLPVSSPYTGVSVNPNPLFPPNSPPLAVVATGGATPLYYNIHQGDVGHTLVFGPTGSGKSVHLAQMVASFRRYENARITVFDKGWSMYALSLLTGGTHYALAAEEGSPGLCPLAFLDDAGDVAWAEEWLATCYELQTGAAPLPAQKGEIHRAIVSMQQTGREESRSLSDFLTIVQNAEIREALRAYSLNGPLGELLDASTDSLASNPFLVFELDELMAMKETILIPVLLYLFRRIEKRLSGAPALLVLDEAWVMLGHPVFAA
ncbi:MAG: transporter, partial [Alphaproteobacteria bacterium]